MCSADAAPLFSFSPGQNPRSDLTRQEKVGCEGQRNRLMQMKVESLEIAESMQPADELRLQQLLQIQFWQRQDSNSRQGEHAGFVGSGESATVPDRWELTRGIALHPWQERCVGAWFAADQRGVIKVVTGAGKTVLALAIAERLQQTRAPNLRLAIVVPTVVLL